MPEIVLTAPGIEIKVNASPEQVRAIVAQVLSVAVPQPPKVFGASPQQSTEG